MIIKSLALGVALSCALPPRPAGAMDPDVGDISCDVISAYAATSPAYIQVFRSYLEGYLAGEGNAGTLGPGDRDAAALAAKAIAYCNTRRDATFAAAVAASLK